MSSRLRLGLPFITAALLAALSACQSPPPVEESSAQVLSSLSQAISASDVASVRLTITAQDMSPRTSELVRTGDQWGGVIGQLPAGSNRTFRAEAFDSLGALLFQGEATGITLLPAQMTAVSLILQPANAPPPFGNAAPTITSVVAAPSSIVPGGPVTLVASVDDPDTGDTLSVAWTGTGGTFSDGASLSTTWTAPQTPGAYTLTLVVRDSHDAASSLSLVLQVQANGSAAVNVSFNSWPQVVGMDASPTTIAPGATTTVSADVLEGDGDALTYAWTASCPGTWQDSTSATARFTPAAPAPDADPSCARCTLALVASDARGGQGVGSLSLCVGTQAAPEQPPLITETFQSALSVQAGSTALLRVGADGGASGPLSFSWQASAGTLDAPTTTASTSAVRWTAPAAAPAGAATVDVLITNAVGATSSVRFTVQVLGSLCPAECPAPNVCQQAGSCDPLSGQCVYQPQPDGTPCGAGSGCMQGTCTSSSLHVEVYDLQGNPLEGARVEVEQTAYSTDFSGAAKVDFLAAGRVVARVEAEGHAPATAVADIRPGGSQTVRVRLLSFGAPLALDATTGGSVSKANIRVTLPPNAVMDESGQLVSGPIEVTIAPLDPFGPSLLAMPGPLEGIGQDGTSSSLLSLSMVEVSLWAEGQPLRLAPEVLAQVELPIPDSLQSTVTLGQEIPAWWFELEAGVWREDGVGKIQPSTTQPGRLAWFANVSHFTWWNADLRWNFSAGASCVRVNVVHALTGNHVPNARVTAYGQTTLPMGGGALVQTATTRNGAGTSSDPACVDLVSGGVSRLAVDMRDWVASSYNIVSNPLPAGYMSSAGSYSITSSQNHGTCTTTANCLEVRIAMSPKTVIKGHVTPMGSGASAGIRVYASYTYAGENFTATAVTNTAGDYCLSVPADVPVPLVIEAYEESAPGRYSSGRAEVTGAPTAGRSCGSGADATRADITVNAAACKGPTCTPDWNRLVGDAQHQTVADIAVDAAGNSFLTGFFSGTATFPPCAPITATGVDAFLVKLNGSGECLWSKSFGGTGTQRAVAVAVDSQGNAILVGHYDDVMNFGGGNSLSTATSYDGFIAKISPAGTHLWSVQVNGSGNEWPTDVAVNTTAPSRDDLAISGFFTGDLLFGYASNGQEDGFVLLGNPEGVFYTTLGAQLFTFGGQGHERALSVAFSAESSGDVIVAGDFNSPFAFADAGTIAPDGLADGFVARLRNSYRQSQASSWIYKLGGGPGDVSLQQLSHVAVNAATKDVFVAGIFDGTLPFSSALPPTNSASFTSLGAGDVILMRLNAEGIPQAARAFGDSMPQQVSSLVVTSGAVPGIFLGGSFTGRMWPGDTLSLTSTGTEDLFVARYDGNLNLRWARQEGIAGGYLTGTRVAVEPGTNRLVLSATTQGPVGSGLNLGLGLLPWAGNQDILVARFLP